MNNRSIQRKTTEEGAALQPDVLQKLHRFNRLCIAMLSIVGFVIDGIQWSDPVLGLAVIQWLWWSECDSFGAKIASRFLRLHAADENGQLAECHAQL